MKILVIDDEPDLLEAFAKLLNRAEHKVVTAENGQVAWELFSKSPDSFHLILADLKMPILGGIEFLERIKKSEHFTPAIIMTGHHGLNSSIQIADLSIIAFLEKPFSFAELGSLIKELESSEKIKI